MEPGKNKIEEQDFVKCAERLIRREHLERGDWQILLEGRTQSRQQWLAGQASALRDRIYGKRIFIRGLIEFTNYCRNDCFYCGIRRSNSQTSRYRLGKEEILSCCEAGYRLGFRTFVLQGGEDPYYTDDRLTEIVRSIRQQYPDCAITLSVGEKDRESYAAYRKAGADRYLLRHETANAAHYAMLHPKEQKLADRIQCLYTLKELGYQTGAGFMVGSPGQTTETLIDDLQFLEELQPEMVGIGPFLPHHGTPFREEKQGSGELTLYLLSLVRLLLPRVLLPATTALGTIDEKGREKGILAGANVVMPNLSPSDVRGKYLLYDHKICTGKEAAEGLEALRNSMNALGYEIAADRGDIAPEC